MGIESSHTALSRIAPRPQLKNGRPDKSDDRQGVQDGELTNVLRNKTPSRASRSMAGVATTSLSPGRPSRPR